MSGGTACSVVVVVEIDSYIAENKIDPKKVQQWQNAETSILFAKPVFFWFIEFKHTIVSAID